MNYLVASMTLYSAGCPEGYNQLLVGLSVIMALIPRIFQGGIQTLLNSYGSLALGTARAGSGLCRNGG